MSTLPKPIDFDVKNTLWLEVTNFCNLRCGHCYNSSGPQESLNPSITPDRYRALLAEAAAIGFRQVQFIGGEPLFYPHLRELVDEANRLGFEEVEIYTNLTRIPTWLLSRPRPRVSIATSFYSDDPAVHDAITATPGSFERTVAAIRRLVTAGFTLRAGVVEMEANTGHFDRARSYLNRIGVEAVGFDKARQFGRAHNCETQPDMSQLCGHCSEGNLSVDVEGQVCCCIMSKPWSFGNVHEASLADLYGSEGRQKFTRDLEVVTKDRQPVTTQGCEPCSPAGCQPCSPPPWCGPQRP
jgi:sulfatase maturation enzyme AslB (radical SAM superfamily)